MLKSTKKLISSDAKKYFKQGSFYGKLKDDLGFFKEVEKNVSTTKNNQYW